MALNRETYMFKIISTSKQMVNEQLSKNLSELINEGLDLRGLDPKKLSELTDIPVHYLSALSNGDFNKLPAVPYVRGYLMRIAEALRIDTDTLLRAYKQEVAFRSIRTSGPEDKLPSNRFIFRAPHRRIIFVIAGAIFLLAIGYFFWRVNDFSATPQIKINSPSVDNLIVNSPMIKLSGEVNPKDKLTVNDEEILVDESGQFSEDFSLQPGVNTIEFKVKRFLGKEAKIIRQVIYQP